MEKLTINSSRSTPGIIFDPGQGVLTIYGVSYPQDAYSFYNPLIDWIFNYLKNNLDEQVEFNLKIEYFDTSSSKCLLEIFEIMEAAYNNGNNIKVNWFYKKDDEDIIESAEELFYGLTLPYQFIME